MEDDSEQAQHFWSTVAPFAADALLSRDLRNFYALVPHEAGTNEPTDLTQHIVESVLLPFIEKISQHLNETGSWDFEDILHGLRVLLNPHAEFYRTSGQEVEDAAVERYARSLKELSHAVLSDCVLSADDGEPWRSQIRVGDELELDFERNGAWHLIAVKAMSPTDTECELAWPSGRSEWLSVDDARVRCPAAAGVAAAIVAASAAPSSQSAAEAAADDAARAGLAAAVERADAWRRELCAGMWVDARETLSRIWTQAIIVTVHERGPGLAGGGGAEEGASTERRLHVQCLGWSVPKRVWLDASSHDLAPLNMHSKGATLVADSIAHRPFFGDVGARHSTWAVSEGSFKTAAMARAATAPALLRALDGLLPAAAPGPASDLARLSVEPPIGTSLHYTSIARTFVEGGGLEMLEATFLDSDLPPNARQPMSDIFSALRIIALVAPHVHLDVMRRSAPKIIEGVTRIVVTMPEAELRILDIDMLERAVDDLKIIAAYGGATVVETGARVVQLVLELALRCLRFEMLQRQLDGLKFLIQVTTLASSGTYHPSGFRVRTLRAPDAVQDDMGGPVIFIRTTEIVPVLHGMSSQELCQWIVDNGVLSLIFDGDGMHEEVIGRSNALIIFLARHNALDDAQLARVWALGTSSHSSTEMLAAVHALLGRVSRFLSPRHVLLLLSWIRALELSSLSVRTLQLACIVAQAQLGREAASAGDASAANDAVRTAAEFLWEVVHKTTADMPIHSAAIASLEELLGKDSAATSSSFAEPQRLEIVQQLREQFVLRSLELIGSDQSALPALCVLQSMLRMHPIALVAAVTAVAAVDELPSSGGSGNSAMEVVGEAGDVASMPPPPPPPPLPVPTRSETIARLQKEHGLLDLVLSEMMRFKARAEAVFEEQRRADADVNPDLVLVPGSTRPYLVQQKTRIEVLKFVLSQSDLTLSETQLVGVWDACVARTFCRAESNCVAWWLNHACGVLASPVQSTGSGFLHFSSSAALHLFESRMCGDACHDHIRRLTKAGFHCLQTFFRYTNAVHKKIVNVALSPSADLAEYFTREWSVVQLELVGLSSVWSVALTCEDAGVASEAVSLLTSIQAKLSQPLQARIAEYRQHYITSCCAQLRRAIDERNALSADDDAASDDFDTKTSRCIALLDSLISRSTLASWEEEAAEPALREARLWLQPQGVRTSGTPIAIGVTNRAKGSPKYLQHMRLTLDSNARLETLWLEVIEHVGLPHEELTLHVLLNHKDGVSLSGFNPDVHLWDYTLDECRIRNGSMVVVYARTAGSAQRKARSRLHLSSIVADPHQDRAQPPPRVAEHPAYLIANDDARLRLLFEALSLARGATASSIWSMLTALPASPAMSAALRGVSAGEPPRDALWCLDDEGRGTSSLASLHYSLLIVEQLMAAPATSKFHDNFYRHNSGDFGSGGTPVTRATRGVRHLALDAGAPGSNASAGAAEEQTLRERARARAMWRQRFVDRGGVVRLYENLTKRDWSAAGSADAESSARATACLSLLLRILRGFVVAAASVSSPSLVSTLLHAHDSTWEVGASAATSAATGVDEPQSPEKSRELATKRAKLGVQSPPLSGLKCESDVANILSSLADTSEEGDLRVAHPPSATVRAAMELEIHCSLSQEHAQRIVDEIDVACLQQVLLVLMLQLAEARSGIGADAANAVEHAFRLSVAIALVKPATAIPVVYAAFERSQPLVPHSSLLVQALMFASNERGVSLPRVPATVATQGPAWSAVDRSANAHSVLRLRTHAADGIRTLCFAFAHTRPSLWPASERIASSRKLPREFFTNLLLKALPRCDIEGRQCEQPAAQFFALLTSLLRDAVRSAEGDALCEYIGILTDCIRVLHATSVAEAHDSYCEDGPVDDVLVGMLNLVSTLIIELRDAHPILGTNCAAQLALLIDGVRASAPNAIGEWEKLAATNRMPTSRRANGASLIHHIFCDFLFALPKRGDLRTRLGARIGDAAPNAGVSSCEIPLCKSAQSRKAAYALLRVLCTGGNGEGLVSAGGGGGGGASVWKKVSPHNLYELMVLLTQHAVSEKVQADDSQWGIDPQRSARAPCGYVGLSNPGCVCYMNALNQQLYMCPELRYGILAVESPPSLVPPPLAAEELAVDVVLGGADGDMDDDDTIAKTISSSSTTTSSTGMNDDDLHKTSGGGGVDEAKSNNPPNDEWSGSDDGEESLDGSVSHRDTDDESDAGSGVKAAEALTAELEKESLLWQLQLMMGNLELSERESFNPRAGWLHAFKDETGKAPTNHLVQQDAYEYLNTLTDRLEDELKGTPQANLLKEVFCATVVNQIKPHDGSGRCRSKRESSYCVSVEVHQPGRGNLEAALEDYVKGEVLSFRFDDNDTKDAPSIECTKRQCLASEDLPPTLVIHLKRFYLDYNTFETEKYNNRFEFGRELDLFPYTVDGLALAEGDAAAGGGEGMSAEELRLLRGACQYTLQGVIVHTGTTRYGHYYSYIHERGAESSERWFEFNDSRVSPFDVSELDRQSFGGRESNRVWNAQTCNYVEEERDIENNAYMLVFERTASAAALAAELAAARDASASDADGDAPITAAAAAAPLVAPSSSAAAMVVESETREAMAVPPAIANRLWRDNVEFSRKRHVFSVEHNAFMASLFGQVATEICAPMLISLTPDIDGYNSDTDDELESGAPSSSSSSSESTSDSDGDAAGAGAPPAQSRRSKLREARALSRRKSAALTGNDGVVHRLHAHRALAVEYSQRPLPLEADLRVFRQAAVRELDDDGSAALGLGAVEGGGRVAITMSADQLLADFIALGEAFFFHQLCHWKDKDDGSAVQQFSEALQRLHLRRPQSAIALMRLHEKPATRKHHSSSAYPPILAANVAHALLSCNIASTRRAVRDVVTNAIWSAYPLESQWYETSLAGPGGGDLSISGDVAHAPLLINEVFGNSVMDYAVLHWHRNREYFEVLDRFSLLGPLACNHLIQMKFGARLIDLFLGKDSPPDLIAIVGMKQDGQHRRSIHAVSNRFGSADWSTLWHTVARIVSFAGSLTMRQQRNRYFDRSKFVPQEARSTDPELMDASRKFHRCSEVAKRSMNRVCSDVPEALSKLQQLKEFHPQHLGFCKPELYVHLASHGRGKVSASAAGFAIAHVMIDNPHLSTHALIHMARGIAVSRRVALIAPFFRLIRPLLR